jgi:Na+-driven multidrug efflux pump
MSKNRYLRLETNLRITSKVGIIFFTLIGIAVYLLMFLGVAFTASKPLAFRTVAVYGVGGALLVGAFILAVLCLFRYFIRRNALRS